MTRQNGSGDPVAVVYLAGPGRSGSTLLEGLLAEQCGGFNVGELAYLWRRGYTADEKCSCGRSFSSCPFWSKVLEQVFGGDQAALDRTAADFDRLVFDVGGSLRASLRSKPVSVDDDGIAALLEVYGALYQAIRDVSGAEVIIDSSKFASYGSFLAKSPDIDLRVIQLVRDSRAVAYSWQRPKLRPEAAGSERKYMPTLKPHVAARTWFADNLAAARLRTRVFHSSLLRYEDFVARPAAIAECLSELGLTGANHPSTLSGHSVSGNPSRMAPRGDRVMKADDEWRQALPAQDRALVTVLTFPLLWRYGYLTMRGSGSRTTSATS